MNGPRARFRPHEHVRSPDDFRRAFDRRRPVSDSRLVVHAIENGLTFARLGISVGKRRVRKATARNRLKRLIREAFRLNKQAMPAGLDLIVVPRTTDVTFIQVRDSLVKLARSASERLGARTGES